MNRKFFAYATAAMLIGFAVMMLPLTLETGPSTYDPWQLRPSSFNEGKSEQANQLDIIEGPVSQPYNITTSSLILLTGLIIALTAYILFKRQLHQQPPTFSS